MLDAARTFARNHRTALIRAAIAVFAIYVLYVLAANIFLNIPLADRVVNRKPERFHIHWSRGYSLYPGHVHLRDVRVGGHVRRNRWEVVGTVASGRIKVLPLLLRRWSFGDIEAENVKLVLDRNAPFLKPSTSNSRLPPWKLNFDGIHTDTLTSLRLGDWTVDGMRSGEATFVLNKTLRGGPIEILPSTLHASSARLKFKDIELARDANIDYAMTMAPNTYKQAQGFERVRFVDARLQLSGRAPGLSLGGADRDFLSFATGKTGGRVDADMSMKAGVLEPGGTLRWSAPLVLQDGQPDPRPERLQVQADVREEGIVVRAQVPKRNDRPDFIDIALRVDERRLQKVGVRELFRKASGDIALRWHFRTLRWLNPLVSESGWLRLDGQADIEAQLRIVEGKLASGSRASVPQAQVEADIFDTVLSAQARALAVVEGKRTKVDFVADAFTLAPNDARKKPYVAGSGLKLELVSSEDLAQFRRTLQAHLSFADARIPNLQAYNRNLPGNSLRLAGGSGTLGADLRLDAQGRVKSGRLNLRGNQAEVFLGASRIIGDLAVDARIAQAGTGPRDYRIEQLDLQLDRVRVDDPKDAPWWARLELDNGRMQWRQPFQVQGDARLQMKDVSVLMTLFSERSALPKWVGNLVDAGQAKATAHVEFAGDTVVIDRLHASNDRVDMDARLRIAKGQPSGALYAKWGVLGVGVELHDGKRKLHLKNAKEWYEGSGDAGRK